MTAPASSTQGSTTSNTPAPSKSAKPSSGIIQDDSMKTIKIKGVEVPYFPRKSPFQLTQAQMDALRRKQ